MDLKLVHKGLNYTHKRKKWVFLFAALGFTGYGAYRVYHSPSLDKKRKRLLKLLISLISFAELVSDSTEAIGVVSKDLKEFIQSDSDQIPNSLRQISKITRSDEFSESVIGVTRALTVGILFGYRSDARKSGTISGNSDFSDRVLDKLFSTAGSGFGSIVVGSFARNLVMALCSDSKYNGRSDQNNLSSVHHFVSESNFIPKVVDVVCEDKCRELIGDCIQMFVSTAVSAYLDKTMDINPYDEIISGLTNPKHETEVREMLVSVCNAAIETLVRTSHQVLTGTNSNSSYVPIDLERCPTSLNNELESDAIKLKELKLFENHDSGWVRKMSSTLSVPSNRRFVLDMTGRVTFETVRSFLEVLLEKLAEGLKTSLHVVHEEVIDIGAEVLRYITVKSSDVVSICLSLCLHILNGPWILVPT